MPTYSLTANGVGTKEWLEATKGMTIKAYTEPTESPHSVQEQPFTGADFEISPMVESEGIGINV